MRLDERYPTIKSFLAAVGPVCGTDSYRKAADHDTWCVRCPACRPVSTGWARFPLVVGRSTMPGRWVCFASCGCTDGAILKVLLRAERAEIEALEAQVEA